MTGWRMGYGVMRADWMHIARLMTNSNSCTASFTQRAAMEAIEGDQSEMERCGWSLSSGRAFLWTG